MEKLTNNIADGLLGRLGALLLPAAVAAMILPPVLARADQEMGMDVGHRSGREGDPLDTNDAGGDGDGGDVQDTIDGVGASSNLRDLILRSTRVLLVPQYNGRILTFKLILLPGAERFVEAGHAK